MKNAKKHAREEEVGMLKCEKREKACQGKEEASMLKCEKREKACQGRRSGHAKM